MFRFIFVKIFVMLRLICPHTKCTLWLNAWKKCRKYPALCRELSYMQKNEKKSEKVQLTSKEIRKLFLNYFVEENGHTYVPSSPVFLNSDPSLLFVNAGMNQFKSLLLNKTFPSHPFYELKRAANTQKCIRISGKHNDLEDVGRDFHHHTFFEMLGNWSFGDYFKKDACRMAWELLTQVYGLDSERLYVTYFGGDQKLNLLPDVECKNIWLDVGVSEDHIYPFGTSDNFWDMGETGPCGPCTEIHYDYGSHQDGLPPPSERINKGRADLIEVWNLVFVQHKREKDQTLHSLTKHHVDTGMGLERLTAVLQGTMSNYDTDIFIPIFRAIEKNFKVRPYQGKIGTADVGEIDTAYRILADHTRMLCIAIADGLFPDSFDAGHILQKIIRRSAYIANRVMKTPPGVLSSSIPYVAETLDFFPEVGSHVKEIEKIVSEEEKVLHQVVNRGRKVRNKMAAETKNGILEGQKIWELNKNHGLDERMIQDLVSEINLKLDWEGYRKISESQDMPSSLHSFESDSMFFCPEVADLIKCSGFTLTDDSFKYNIAYNGSSYSVQPVIGQIIAILADKSIVQAAESGKEYFIVTDETNFYSSAGGQVGDKGEILGEDFVFKVKDAHLSQGYVFHEGLVQKGTIQPNVKAEMLVLQDHRQRCMQNHTATHLLNAALRRIFPFAAQRSSYVGPTYLKFGFSSREPLSEQQIKQVENFVNHAIQEKLNVSRNEVPFEELTEMKNVIMMRGEDYPEKVFAITVGDHLSVEPCCGTHVQNTSDIGQFVIVPHKSQGGTIRIVKAVTGHEAELTCKRGEALDQTVRELEKHTNDLLSNTVTDHNELQVLLKEVKKHLFECQKKTDVPLLILRKNEQKLKDLRLALMDACGDFSEDNSTGKRGFMKKHKEPDISPSTVKLLEIQKIASTVDEYKYDYYFRDSQCCVKPISSNILAVIQNDSLVSEVDEGRHCLIVTDKTNFFSESCGQVGDKGLIHGKDFVVDVEKVYSCGGFVFHDAWVQQGKLRSSSLVQMSVDQLHRQRCSANHTAVHLLHSALKKTLPYAFQRSTFVDSSCLQLDFSSKTSLTIDEIGCIENIVNDAIQREMGVTKFQVPSSQLKEVPNICIPPGEKFPEQQTVVSIGQAESCSDLISVEPCCGTHVDNTSAIGEFVIVSYKTVKGPEKSIRAVTGDEAKAVLLNGKQYSHYVTELQENVKKSLEATNVDYLELWDYLKEMKRAKGYHEVELPLKMFREHQDSLSEYISKLTNVTQGFIADGFEKAKKEMVEVLKQHKEDRYVVHKMSSVGDGKKIINLALSFVPDRPSMFFVREGSNTVICSCTVPKELVNSSFSALLWIHPVAVALRGKSRESGEIGPW